MSAGTSAVLTVDLHYGHLDPKEATLPVPADRARDVIKNTERVARTISTVELFECPLAPLEPVCLPG